MATVNVKLNVDTDALLRGRSGLVSRVMAGFSGVVTRTVRQTADERVQRRTGQYVSGIHSTWDGRKITTTAGAPHSIFLERGTRPHVIRPRRAGGFLRFTTSDGRVVYAKAVQHPGTRPYNILRDGVARAGREYFGG